MLTGCCLSVVSGCATCAVVWWRVHRIVCVFRCGMRHARLLCSHCTASVDCQLFPCVILEANLRLCSCVAGQGCAHMQIHRYVML